MSFDQKEDFRLRMADLEKKLAESEEERRKLEKTCNVLMRAFREEEKMQYKALNKKYEKFLEDCSVRKRRNEIIMRSLCRIEDRTKALFAKTERLKLLKDRYISHLKINYVKKDDLGFSPSRSFLSQNMSNGIVKWTTPRETPKRVEFQEEERITYSRSPIIISRDLRDRTVTGWDRGRAEELQMYQDSGGKTEQLYQNSGERNVFNGTTEDFGRTATFQSVTGTTVDRFGFPDSQESFEKSQVESDRSVSEKQDLGDKFESKIISGNNISKHENATSHHPIEKMKKVEEYSSDEKIEEEEDGQQTQNVLHISSHKVMVHTTNIPTNEEEPPKNEEAKTSENVLPKGLDGVDYQNETYPESYYEQPVHHHNHTSIASDVILEEDETEPDAEEEGKESENTSREVLQNFLEKERSYQSNGSPRIDEPQQKHEDNELSYGVVPINGKTPGKVEGQDSDTDISSEVKQEEEKSEKLEMEDFDKSKIVGKSNLSQLLESDSESFQIEHGNVISGNDDSDFDFSFHQK